MFRRFYENYTGLFHTLVVITGLLIGGLIAFDPALHAGPSEEQSDTTPTATPLPPTPVSIQIPTPMSTTDNAETADELTADAVLLDNGWLWKAPEALSGRIQTLSDGMLSLQAESGTVYLLTSGGGLDAVVLPPFEISADDPEPRSLVFNDKTIVFLHQDFLRAVHPTDGVQWEIELSIDQDNNLTQFFQGESFTVAFDTAQSLHAFSAQDGLLWSYKIDGTPNSDFYNPIFVENDIFVFSERGGSLYAFSREGQRWSYSPGENLRSTTDPVFGPDGNLYYVVSGGTTGVLLSITPEGQENWRTRLDTFQIYSQPAFTAGGAYIFVEDDFVSLDNGTLLDLEIPYDVNGFYTGADGFDYLITGQHIMRWQIGPDGYEELLDVPINTDGFNRFFAPFLHIYDNGLIEFSMFTNRGGELFWINPADDTVESIVFSFEQLRFSTQQDSPEYVRCDPDAETGSIRCAKNIPGSPEPIWSLDIEGIFTPTPGFQPFARYINGQLFIAPDPQTLYALDLDIP